MNMFAVKTKLKKCNNHNNYERSFYYKKLWSNRRY